MNVSEYRCDALLLTAEGLRHVPLDGLDAEEVEVAADAFHTDVVTALDPRAVQDEVDAANERVTATLDLLWREVPAPVLAGLRMTDPDTRIGWVPTQALCRLPLHAATAMDPQDPQDPQDPPHPQDASAIPKSLVDRTVSSYTPTVTALQHARARGAAPDRTVAAVVHADVHADVRRPGLPELPAACREARVASDRLGVEALISALLTCTHLHMALHAVVEQDGPGTSCFLLSDLDLTFVTSALLLVGFSGVIGTLWRVPDAVAETTARVFYDALDTARDEPAVALARTVRLVRVHYGDAPAAWSAHHHVGI
ncbi:CHAT domain-containing protein [Streptomyces prunicolor]|uniref:CHAT domain-containing protein n=1 Tax=Streptomyces prunicolor TaxID=67348 RepID=UPI003712E7EE